MLLYNYVVESKSAQSHQSSLVYNIHFPYTWYGIDVYAHKLISNSKFLIL